MEKEFDRRDIITKDMATMHKFVESLKLRKPFAKKVGRNELCPCGSGLKFKKCCLKNL